MGALFWFLKMFAKVLKPFVKIALAESLLEALMGVIGEEEETEAPTEEETPTEG